MNQRIGRLFSIVLCALILVVCNVVSAEDERRFSSGIAGSVFSSPACPAININNPCPDRPVSVEVVVADSSNKIIARTKSDRRGAFFVALPPGEYTVSAKGGIGSPKYPETSRTVSVSRNSRAKVKLIIDSGIR